MNVAKLWDSFVRASLLSRVSALAVGSLPCLVLKTLRLAPEASAMPVQIASSLGARVNPLQRARLAEVHALASSLRPAA